MEHVYLWLYIGFTEDEGKRAGMRADVLHLKGVYSSLELAMEAHQEWFEHSDQEMELKPPAFVDLEEKRKGLSSWIQTGMTSGYYIVKCLLDPPLMKKGLENIEGH
jgi:glucose-6-phosphate isomerase